MKAVRLLIGTGIVQVHTVGEWWFWDWNQDFLKQDLGLPPPNNDHDPAASLDL